MYCDCLHYLLNNKQSTALRTCFNVQIICVLYLYKYNPLFYAKHQTLYQAIRPTRDVRLVIHTANVALHRFKQYTDRIFFINKIKMYTNYPNTEQITQINDPKGWTQHLGEFSFSLPEVLQVCYVIWYDHVNPRSVFCTCEINPRKSDASIFNGSQTLILFNLIQFYNICRLTVRKNNRNEHP